MSYGDNLPPPNPGSFGPGPGGPPPKRGMSTTAKVLLILGGVFGVMLLLCCGGGIYLFNSMRDSFTQKPQEVRAIGQKIVSIQVPRGYQPQMGMDLNILGQKVKMAVYVAPGGGGQGGMLMLMQMPQQATEEQMRQQMDQMLAKQGQKQQITIDARETRTVLVEGREVEFEFIEGTHAETGAKLRQVIGQFPGRGGTAMLMLIVPEVLWDEEEVMEMLESIER